jgi:mitofilin
VTATALPTPPPPPTPKKRRRFLRFLVYLTLLGGGAFVGGVFYSLKSDNFHDFFTEYVPFGEQAVLFLEEREFRKRFPSTAVRSQHHVHDLGNKVKIPKASGMTSTVTSAKDKDSSDRSGNRSEGAEDRHPHVQSAQSLKNDREAPRAEATGPPLVNTKNGNSDAPTTGGKSPSSPLPATAESSVVSTPTQIAIKPIDPINIKDAREPIVQDVVKVLNNIIAALNANGDSPQDFSSIIDTAKSDILAVGNKVSALKRRSKRAADKVIKENHEEFDRAARELLRRLEGEMKEQESRWKEEFESEREKIVTDYENKLKAELEHTKKVEEQIRKNQLLEQAIDLKKQFTSEVQSRVETERSGRLGQLESLSSSVEDLEKITVDSSKVISENLKTQHLHIALSALRSALASPDQPRSFLEELEAVKEVAPESPVVTAAIASINPVAYQRGVPTNAQLIDRFRRVSTEVRKAALLPADAGVASHAMSLVLSKLLFRRQGLVEGDDVESVLTRTETLLEEGDLDAATREMNALSGWARTLSRDWVTEARRVLEVRQALDVSFSIVFAENPNGQKKALEPNEQVYWKHS